jgi:hypothetical protein
VIAPKDLVADLQKELRLLERDLFATAESSREVDSTLRKRHEVAENRSRTGLTFETWRGQQLTQVAAGWVLACVYTRFCEDNRMLDAPMLAGPGDRLAEARDRQTEYFRTHPADSDLEYLRAAVGRLKDFDATRALVDKHNPMHLIAPSPDRATDLLEFWRRIDPATGALVHDFTDDKLGTRFLGDLYQDLSEQARKDYALLQTPEFIEEFILDGTLDPAIDEYGLAEVKLIDPACGSGHFLLGAFARLLNRWRQQEPGTNVRVLVERALGQVHGVDINPYAAAIARFRLVVAALTACRIARLADAPTWKIRVAIGDSLRFGVRHLQDELVGISEQVMTGLAGEGEFVYEYEDAAELQEILGQRYHAVVANPPYITVKDPTLNSLYRELWWACSGLYALTVPFAQRLYDLAVPGGFTGQITSNSFMKREFGKKLIEQFFLRMDLNLVIDTSGAYIPGHGTPTVIICGRNRRPLTQNVRAVLGNRGEPGTPEDPAKGLVWASIVDHVDVPGSEDEWVTVTDLDRGQLAVHPWSLSGGNAGQLQQLIEMAQGKLGSIVRRIGFMAMSHADQAFTLPSGCVTRVGLTPSLWPPLIPGDAVRDFSVVSDDKTYYPYGRQASLWPLLKTSRDWQWLWPLRTELGNRATFGGGTYFSERRPWYEWHQVPKDQGTSPLSIAFAFVATHNHFVLDRGGKVFKQSAPVIKLPDGATEQDHLRVLGLLNSSTACFWLKQVSHNKGSTVDTRGARQTTVDWENFYEFTGTKLEQFPLPDGAPLVLATRLDALAAALQQVRPSAVATAATVATRSALDAARAEWERIRSEMLLAQEELDWEVYGLYGLLGDDADDLIGTGIDKPALRLGERAFEIALARQMERGEAETEWFNRHRSTPITELPSHWPADYRVLVERRLAKIADEAYLRLIERPEYKRRWVSPPWEEMEANALRDWLLDRLEARVLWFRPGPAVRSVAQLADALRTDADFVSVAGLYARDADLGDVIAALVRDQHVPYIAPLRYTESGMRIRAQRERTWDLQRHEDSGEKAATIPVPPKYKQGDFRDLAYWRNRGKLDVPKERFISYPGASRDGTVLLGWAGWDHLEQAQALTAYITERRELDAWGTERLKPLLAGLAELLPWVAQWHAEVDPEFGVRPADAYGGFLDEQLLRLGLTRTDLANVGPEPSARARRRAGTSTRA